MEFRLDVFVAQLLNFLVIFFFVKYFFGDQIRDIIHYRRGLDKKYDDVEAEIAAKLTQAEADKKALIDEAVAHKNSVVQQAELAAQNKADKIVADAQWVATRIQDEAKVQAGKLEKDLEDNFVTWVKQTAYSVVKKIFNTDVALQEKYLEELASEFRR